MVGTWRHVLLTYDGINYTSDSSYKLYIDGISQSFTSGGGVDNPLQQNRIGNQGVYNFDGLIDDVKIWNYALTTEQVKLDYNGGAAVRFE